MPPASKLRVREQAEQHGRHREGTLVFSAGWVWGQGCPQARAPGPGGGSAVGRRCQVTHGFQSENRVISAQAWATNGGRSSREHLPGTEWGKD